MKKLISFVVMVLITTTMVCSQTKDKPIKDFKQCIAYTQQGIQCSRTATKGSVLCTQHLKMSKDISIKAPKVYYLGPKGGIYYYNTKGRKVYVNVNTAFHWQYTTTEINRATLCPYEELTSMEQDTMYDLIEQWWILRENWDCGTVTQHDVDSIESALMTYTEI